jgi:hypothetical protein
MQEAVQSGRPVWYFRYALWLLRVTSQDRLVRRHRDAAKRRPATRRSSSRPGRALLSGHRCSTALSRTGLPVSTEWMAARAMARAARASWPPGSGVAPLRTPSTKAASSAV